VYGGSIVAARRSIAVAIARSLTFDSRRALVVSEA
jgi:hypothetical protein